MPSRKMEVGDTFSAWTLLEFRVVDEPRTYGKFSCECRRIENRSRHTIRSGKSQSCGCRDHANKTTHNMSNTRTYEAWKHMKQRCNNTKGKHYKSYGGRGIAVCEQWNKFESFYADMGESPAGMSLDRIDNNKDYSRDNCRWATQKEQCSNQRRTRYIDAFGIRKTVAEWACILKVPTYVMANRLSKGNRTHEEIVTMPTKVYK